MNSSMTIEELLGHVKNRRGKKHCKHHMRTQMYRDHYPLIKEAVEKGAPLGTAIKAFRQHSEEDPFPGKSDQTIWQAFRRALEKDGIKLRVPDKG